MITWILGIDLVSTVMDTRFVIICIFPPVGSEWPLGGEWDFIVLTLKLLSDNEKESCLGKLVGTGCAGEVIVSAPWVSAGSLSVRCGSKVLHVQTNCIAARAFRGRQRNHARSVATSARAVRLRRCDSQRGEARDACGTHLSS